MDKQAPGVEWQVAKDEVEWEDFCAPPIPNQGPPVQRRWHRQRSRWTVALLALFLVGGWWWHMAQTDRLQAGVAERTRKAVEPNAVTQSDDPVTLYGQRHSVEQAVSLRAAIQTSEPDNPFDLGVDTVEVQGDQAVARIVTTAKDGAPAYRQTRFYRRTDAGWVRTDPDAVLMGSARSLETPCCVFHFRQNDASAVIAVAPRVDGLSTAIRHNFGLTSTPGGMKLVIEVSVTQPPGQALSWYDVPDRFIVPSPVLYRAPVELTDVDLLAQSIAFPLLNAMLAQASELYGIDSAWQPIVRGLYR